MKNWMFSVDSSPPILGQHPKVSITMLGTPDAAVSPKFLRNCHGGNYRNHDKNDEQRAKKTKNCGDIAVMGP